MGDERDEEQLRGQIQLLEREKQVLIDQKEELTRKHKAKVKGSRRILSATLRDNTGSPPPLSVKVGYRNMVGPPLPLSKQFQP
jgi:hypothetical protein